MSFIATTLPLLKYGKHVDLSSHRADDINLETFSI